MAARVERVGAMRRGRRDDHGDFPGFQRSDVSRAVAAGLTIRPIADTAADTLRWAREADPDPGPAMTREREAALLREWSLI